MKPIKQPEKLIIQQAFTKRAALQWVCQQLVTQGIIRSAATVADELLLRENIANTLISEGTALPHCQSIAVRQTRVVLVDASEFPIDWTAGEAPVTRLIFLLLAEDAPEQQLLAVSQFTRRLADERNVSALFEKA